MNLIAMVDAMVSNAPIAGYSWWFAVGSDDDGGGAGGGAGGERLLNHKGQ